MISEAASTQLAAASFAQQRLWFLDRLDGGALYHVPLAVRLRGVLDRAAAAAALADLVARHEALRTGFALDQGEVVQVIHSQRAPDWSEQAANAAALGDLLTAEARKPFDLAGGRLIRAVLWRIGAEDHVLQLTLHHIISDGWSLGIMLREFAAAYRARAGGAPPELPPLELQYADFAAWQRETERAGAWKRPLAFWRERLAGAPADAGLPPDRPRTPALAAEGGTLRFRIEAALAGELRELSRQTGGSLYMTLLAGFALTLQRLGAGDDLIIGTPVAARPRPELEGIVGFFVNALPLRLDLSGAPTVRELLRRVRASALDAFGEQELPFDRLVQELRPERSLGRSPFFQVVFVLQNAPTEPLDLPGLETAPIEVDTGTAKYDLTLAIEESGSALVGRLEFNSALFDVATIERLAEHFQTLLGGMATAPAGRAAAIELAVPAERRRLAQLGLGPKEPPFGGGMAALFAEQVKARPDAIAVRFGNAELSYAELDRQSEVLARVLVARGVGPETLVPLCLDRSLELVIALIAVVKAGAAYVGLDPEHPGPRLAQVCAETAAPLVLSQRHLSHRLPAGVAVLALDQPLPPVADGLALRSDPVPPDRLAYVSYTSGSTGRPKGVAVTQRGVVRLVKAGDYARFDEAEIWLQLAPLAFDASTLEIWGALLNGAKLVVAPPGAPTLEELGRLIREERITSLWLPAGLFQLVADERLGDLRGLRQLLAGGDVLPPAQVRRLRRELPGLRLINGYGPTENTTFTCCHAVRDSDLDGGAVPIGRPIAGTAVHILDERFQPAPIGVPGELYAGGAGLARGYLAQADLTAERFVPDPFSDAPGARLYRTGDRARWRSDGTVEFLGRIDRQLKLRGHRIEPGEVEAALAAAPGVKAAAVSVRGEGNRRQLIGYVTGPVEADAVREHLRGRVPDYLVPAAVIVLEALPLTPNGKVDRGALPEPDFGSGSAGALPRTPAEEILCHLFARVLELDTVPADRDFFSLGGHSLLATQLATRIREAFGVELPLRAIFEAPTAAALAVRLGAARIGGGAPESGPVPVPRGGDMPLSYAQERLWFLNQLEPENPFYNMPAALRLRGSFDPAVAERVLRELVRRHEALRTGFAAADGRPAQRFFPDRPAAFDFEDLSALAGPDRNAAWARIAAAEARRPFDLGAGPLLRVRLVRLAPEEHGLLLTLHHIVSDGWSMGVLTREMGQLYAAFAAGRPSPLPELPLQYADFAVWQRRWLDGGVLAAQLGYWKGRLAGAPPVLALPTDRPRPPRQSFRGGSHAFAVGPALSRRLAAFSREAGATLFMTLQAAFALLLGRSSNQDDVIVGTPIANRRRREAEPLIGFFVNTLVLRTDLAGSPSFRELVARVRQTALEAYAHQDLPFERLVDELHPERDLSRNPVFQVMFALHNTPSGRQELPGLVIEEIPAERISAQFDLVLDVWETPDGLKAVFEYAADLFDAGTIQRLAGHFRNLLGAAVDEPEAPAARLPLLGADERHELLAAFNATAMPYPHDRTLDGLFGDQAARTPSRIAAWHRGRGLSYAELEARANRLAGRLRRLGVGRGDFVGIFDERGLDFLTAMVGILKAGAAFLPIDPAYPLHRIRYMIADSGLRTLVTRGPLLAGLAPEGAALRDAVLFDDGAAAPEGCRVHPMSDWEKEPATAPASGAGPEDHAYLLYTSGSTGEPKGAIIRHNGAVNHIYGQFRELAFHSGTAFLQSAPSSSDISVWQFLAPLLIGGRTVIADFEAVCDAARLHALIRSEAITLIELVPVVLKELLDRASALAPSERTLPALEFAMVTGEAVSPALVAQWFRTYPGVRLVNAYGPTEAADDVCQAVLSAPLPADRTTVPIGRTLPNLTMYVLDRELQLVPVGVAGELCVSGVGIGAGYWRKEEKTREAFVPNPHAGNGRGATLYRTGDLGRWLPDGSLEMLGRFDQQVKLRGFRIELGEIESAISRHPGVGEAAVAACDDGTGDRRLVAYITVDQAAEGLARRTAALAEEQVGLWQDLHENSYQGTLDYGDATFNVIGWDSNYDGQPLPEAEMREYVARTTERVRELGPRRVLEIGCGTGLLLFAVAPLCEAYVGTDLSRVAIRRLEAALAVRPQFGHVAVRAARADDFEGLEPASFDLVMLSSVTQYFPGADYLIGVLEGAVRLLRPGGAILLGDVRLRPLLPAFHASVQLFKAPDALPAAGLRQRVRAALAREQEMAIDPELFAALRTRLPEIARVEIQPKRGGLLNELTRFRADVILRTGSAPPAPGLVWREWSDCAPGLAGIRRELAARPGAPLALRRVANPRVHRELRTLAWMETAVAGETVGALRIALDAEDPAGIDPEDLRALAAQLDCDVQLSLRLGALDGSFDVVFQPRARGRNPAPVDFLAAPPPRPWRAYANNPLQERLGRELVPALRGFLRERLPAHMVPSDFVLLDLLPVLPNGKVDRRALPVPERATGGEDVAPATPTEAKLAAIWSAVLGRDRIGCRTNFFELGGHSLKATQVVSRIQREWGVEIALREVFDRPTIAELAREIDGRKRTGHERIPAIPPADDYAPSHAQLRLWVLAQLEGASAAYNLPAALRIDGALDAAALERAADAVVRRHEALRTTFPVVAGAPRQRVHAEPLGRLEREDLSDLPDPAGAARGQAREDAARPFDLERGPLIRLRLLRLAPERHVLLVNLHHIVTDDWSLGVIARELSAAYAACARGDDPGFAPLPIHYRDTAAWQNAQLAGPGMDVHRDYWRRRFAGKIPVLELAPDFPRPGVKTYDGRSRAFALPPERAAELAEICRREGCSLFMLLVAAVQTLLHRMTGQRDLIVGFPIAGRNHPDLEDQIGFYVNTLPLRSEVDPAEPFAGLLGRVRAAASEAYEHQAYPFDRLVGDLALERDVSRSPLFDVIVVMQNVEPYALALEGAAVAPFLDESEVSKFDLAFNFEERGGALRGSVVFNPRLFADERIARLTGHLLTLLGSIAADPTRPVGRLELLGADERAGLVRAAGDPRVRFPSGDTLAARFEAQAEQRPESVALALPGAGGRHLTYGELNARANRLAARLRALGIGPESLVGLYTDRSLEMVVGLLAILKAGGAYLPLDPAHPPERIAETLLDAAAPVVLTQGALARHLAASAARLLPLDEVLSGPAGSEPNPPGGAGPDAAAYVIYTSGSTGRPKGCAVTNRNVVRLFDATASWFHFASDDVWTLFHSHAFDFSVWEIFGALLYGGRLVVVPFAVSRSPEAFRELLAREEVTVLNQTPSAFRQLMAADEAASSALALRTVIFGGEALDIPALRPWFDRHGDERPRLVNMYGITETTVHVTYRPLRRSDCDVPRSVIGVPIPDLQVQVVDADLQPVPVGVPGEIVVGGAGVARGYLNRPELTAERFVPDPATPGGLRYRSGDLGRRLAGGEIEYLGRIDQQVKIRGFRIEPGEIEAALARHPAVREALVVPREDRAGDRRLVAYVVLRAPAETAELREFLKPRLPDYMVPSAVVALAAFPLTTNGKVDRRALPAPEASAVQGGDGAAPDGELEELVAGLWRQALGLERVGRDANFFDLGGNSLLVVQVHRGLREALGREVPLVELFTHATPASLAAFLGGASAPAETGVAAARERAARRREAGGRRGGNPR